MKNVMKWTMLVTYISLMILNSKGFAQQHTSKISGIWYAEEMDQSTIKVYKAKNGFWYAKITQSAESKYVDKVIFEKGKYDTKNQTYAGTMIHPKNDLKIQAKISVVNDQKLKVVGRKMLITKTFYWIKP